MRTKLFSLVVVLAALAAPPVHAGGFGSKVIEEAIEFAGKKFGREIAGVAAADELMRGIATQYICNPGHRYDK